MPGTGDESERRYVAQEQHRLLRQRRAVEVARAHHLIEEFLASAAVHAIDPVPLVVHSGRGLRARTSLRGWYLRADRSVAIDTEGRYYLLNAPVSLLEWLFGADPQPQEPRLIINEGGPDGHSIDLVAALSRLRLGQS